MTDREYILENLTYEAHGLQGPEAHFTYADGYGFTQVHCGEQALRTVKTRLTEDAINNIIKYAGSHPIQPNVK